MWELLRSGMLRQSPDVHSQLQELRADTLRLFLVLAIVSYFVWHVFNTAIGPKDHMVQVYAVVPFAVPALAGAYALLFRSQRAAAGVFIGGGLVAISWAIYILDDARFAMLYAVLALMAAFVIHPLGGFLTIGTALAALALLENLHPGLVRPNDYWSVAIFGTVAVVGVWALMHRLLLALTWYTASFAEAECRTREAQEHRAQLSSACKQLDTAYYRLERANSALQLAWKTASEAERSRMEFAVNISHELRTPLNLIVGYSEMMMTSPSSYEGTTLPLPYRGDLNAMYRSAQHLLALSDDILDLARMEVGRLGLVREPVDLSQLIRDAAALVKDYAEAKGLALILDVPIAAPTLMMDRLRIRQVLLNLLTNAARFTDRGQIEVCLVQREHDVRVTVNDSGSGIAPDDLPVVFQQFVTRDKPGSEWHSGSGLGLPISKRFVELHGGEMEVESTPGIGTSFWFTLPLLPADRSGSSGTATGIVPAYLRPQEQVLVLAHRDPRLQRLLQRYLDGFHIEIADNLSDAESRAVEMKASAVIADLDAPSGHGIPLVPMIRCPLPHLERLVERLGVADYLVKPISREAFLCAIRKLHRPISRVLIVDDDVRFVRFLARILSSSRQGYSISTAHNGLEALVRLEADRPDLVLLDLAIPGLDGPGVLKWLATQPDLQASQVIVISARDEGEGSVPLGTEFRVDKPEGYCLAELTQLIGASVSKLTPVRGYLGGTETIPSEVPPG